ncbi:MAG: hypothetical protein FJ109_15620 [Deltaproteobacteria bacterium]|nr:hypothetical protein [Deltaproteobacteria bacterium]
MRRSVVFLTSLFVLFSFPRASSAESYDERKAREYKAALCVCGETCPFIGDAPTQDCYRKPPSELFANGKVVATDPAQFSELAKYVSAWKDRFDVALNQWNGSPRFRQTFSNDDRKAIIAALRERQEFYILMAEAMKGSAGGLQGKQDACRAFKKDVLTRDERERIMTVFIAEKNNGDAAFEPQQGRYIQALYQLLFNWHPPKEIAQINDTKKREEAERALRAVAALTEVRAHLDAVAAACEAPENAGIGVTWCVDRQDERVTKPKSEALAINYVRSWCIIAIERAAVLERFLKGFIADDLEKRGPPFGPGPRIDTRDPIFLADLELTPETRKKILDSYAEIQAAAKIQVELTDELLAPLAAKYAEVLARIDEIAPNEKHPKAGKALGYVDKLVKAALKEKYPTATFKKWGMSEGDWDIKKDYRGIPLSQERYGWVEYQVRGEKWCRYGVFQVYEEYDGTRFRPDSDVWILDETFLKCQ